MAKRTRLAPPERYAVGVMPSTSSDWRRTARSSCSRIGRSPVSRCCSSRVLGAPGCPGARLRTARRQAGEGSKHAVEMEGAHARLLGQRLQARCRSSASIRRQARVTVSVCRSAATAGPGVHRLHGRKPAATASAQVAWNQTFSGRAGREGQEAGSTRRWS